MIDRNILYGQWLTINSREEFDKIVDENIEAVGGSAKGIYINPGNYYRLDYMERCKRGCCSHSIIELMDENSALNELENLIVKIQTIQNRRNDVRN